MHEFALMQRGIGWVMCLAFPAVVVAMTVAYVVVLWREGCRGRGPRDDEG
jgi:hypothetical protein